MKLSEIADIQIGYQSRPKKGAASAGDTAKEYGFIQIKDFDPEGNLTPGSLDTIELDTKPDRYLVEKGDVLFVSRGLRLIAAPVEKALPGVIVSSYLFRIRLNTEAVDPRYLAWCLNHTPGERFLQSGATQGSNMPYVSMRHLKDFPVPVPPLDVQRRIVAIDRLRQEENRLTERLKTLRYKLIEHFSMSLLSTHTHAN